MGSKRKTKRKWLLQDILGDEEKTLWYLVTLLLHSNIKAVFILHFTKELAQEINLEWFKTLAISCYFQSYKHSVIEIDKQQQFLSCPHKFFTFSEYLLIHLTKNHNIEHLLSSCFIGLLKWEFFQVIVIMMKIMNLILVHERACTANYAGGISCHLSDSLFSEFLTLCF